MRPLSPTVWTSPQLPPEAMEALAQAGLKRVINNRPDGEDPGQPASVEVEAAARAAGLDYVWIPISGLPAPAQVDAVGAALGDGEPTVLFCRSGMRSAAAWAMARSAAGDDPESLRSAAAEAGYDLGRVPL
ncbi:TIGR01244 family sulfur transferase [Brevundimonas kwangchunensis]|uniref:TIGR01244 family sulfur transferase n=1 Tax=Brevundimonas kwangchunensis TaxID=322163 RepID=A0ABP3RYW2_9CAUL